MVTLVDSPAKARWFAPHRDLDAEKALCETLGLPSLLCASLIARGIRFPEDVDVFLNPKLEDLHEPLLLPDADLAVKEIMLAKDRGETIYIHGDYDVDGVTSTAIWTRSLRKLGFEVIPHVPHRIKEGYGIHELAVREAIDSGAKVFLTCDCGTSAVKTVAMARESGMRVIVTDHHELGPVTPEAHALVNPHRPDSKYPFPHLCGAAVAFKIAQAVAEECGATRNQFIRAYLDLVCLGTIADVVPLIGENRILASFGLKSLAESKKKGIQALLSVAKIDVRVGVTAFDVGWRLGPRINAAGRVDDAEHALRLLLTDDDKEAREAAELLDSHNQARRDEEKRILAHADEIILENELQKRSLIFVAAPGWHPGVIGIVAGRIAEKYFRPALVASINDEDGTARGSARSIPAFELHKALVANRDLFITCGGHAKAAGFSIENSRIEEATEQLIAYADGVLSPEDVGVTFIADSEVQTDELDLASFKALQRMQPFGEMNPQPRFIVRDCTINCVKPTATGEHMQFALDCKRKIYGIGFDMAPNFDGIEDGAQVDVLFEPRLDEYNGAIRPKLYLKAIERV